MSEWNNQELQVWVGLVKHFISKKIDISTEKRKFLSLHPLQVFLG